MQGLFIVISAPSGAGKSTLCKQLMSKHPEVCYSVSCTTRSPRGSEKEGVNYFFVDRDQFVARRDAGDFIEWAEVHGELYGTPAGIIDELLEQGKSVIMDIDVQGAAQIRQAVSSEGAFSRYADVFVDIFVTTSSLEELRSRLEERGEDSPEVIERRMKNAVKEMEDMDQYRYTLINDDLIEASRSLEDIYLKELGRVNGTGSE